jgi:SMI1 / KNR4 family (SUKH-1)
MNVAPFAETEYIVLQHLLAGDSLSLELLRQQVDSLRWESDLYRSRRILGFQYHPRTVFRKAQEVSFRVGWGYGCEDWQLGDRRPIGLRDAVVELNDSRYLYLELMIRGGLLSSVRMAGVADSPGTELHAFSQSLATSSVAALWYCPPWEPDMQILPAELGASRFPASLLAIDPNANSMQGNTNQQWLLDLRNQCIQKPGRKLPLRFRAARPASEEEIDCYEKKNGIVVPSELREFWLATNGAAFFGDIIRGTYDALVWPGDDRCRILFLESMLEEGVHLVFDLSAGSSVVVEEDVVQQAERRSWGSLWDCLRMLVEERRRMCSTTADRVLPK